MNSDITKIKKDLKQIKSKSELKNIKSKFILQKIFSHFQKRKALEIITYNKYMQHRMNINVDNYKEYSEIYSLIEIRIKPVNNKYGKFININDKNKIYFHIYFNNNKEEIKRNYLNKNEEIKIIKIIIDYQAISFKNLFHKSKCIESINFKKFYRNNITNMSFMFYGCSFLKEINFSKFKSDNITNMSGMFSWCLSLEELNLSNFNANNLINMYGMFSECSDKLKKKIKTKYKNIKEEAFYNA